MNRIKAFASSPLVSNMIGVLTLLFAALAYFNRNQPVAQVAGDAPVVASNLTHPWFLAGTAFVGLVLLLPSWVALYRSFYAKPSPTTDPNTSGRSAEQILDFISGIKGLNNRLPIKIVSIKEWMPFSRTISKAIQIAGYVLQENPSTANFIFLATAPHNSVVLRYRSNQMFGVGIRIAMSALAQPCNFEEFPDTDAYNFIRIEIGGAP
jgi:hypothetical protein